MVADVTAADWPAPKTFAPRQQVQSERRASNAAGGTNKSWKTTTNHPPGNATLLGDKNKRKAFPKT